MVNLIAARWKFTHHDDILNQNILNIRNLSVLAEGSNGEAVTALTVGVPVPGLGLFYNSDEGWISPKVNVLGTISNCDAIITVLDVVVLKQHVGASSREAFETEN